MIIKVDIVGSNIDENRYIQTYKLIQVMGAFNRYIFFTESRVIT